MTPVAERIFLYKDDKLVTFASLTEEEREEVQKECMTRMSDRIMASKGYKRVGEIHKKENGYTGG